MDLSKSPYQQIQRPKFGDMDLKATLNTQWSEWKKDVKLVHELFVKLQAKKKNLGSLDPNKIRDFINDISTKPDDRAAMSVRQQITGITDRFTTRIIVEAVRRFIDKHKNEFSEISDTGAMPWEE